MTEKIEWYREVLELEPNSKVFFPLAKLLAEENESEQAMAVLQKGLERHHDFLEARLFLIELLHKNGRAGECDGQVQKLAKLFASYAGFWQAWAACLEGRKGEEDTASMLRFLAAGFLHGPLSLHEVLNRGLDAIARETAAPRPEAGAPRQEEQNAAYVSEAEESSAVETPENTPLNRETKPEGVEALARDDQADQIEEDTQKPDLMAENPEEIKASQTGPQEEALPLAEAELPAVEARIEEQSGALTAEAADSPDSLPENIAESPELPAEENSANGMAHEESGRIDAATQAEPEENLTAQTGQDEASAPIEASQGAEMLSVQPMSAEEGQTGVPEENSETLKTHEEEPENLPAEEDLQTVSQETGGENQPETGDEQFFAQGAESGQEMNAEQATGPADAPESQENIEPEAPAMGTGEMAPAAEELETAEKAEINHDLDADAQSAQPSEGTGITEAPQGGEAQLAETSESGALPAEANEAEENREEFAPVTERSKTLVEAGHAEPAAGLTHYEAQEASGTEAQEASGTEAQEADQAPADTEAQEAGQFQAEAGEAAAENLPQVEAAEVHGAIVPEGSTITEARDAAAVGPADELPMQAVDTQPMPHNTSQVAATGESSSASQPEESTVAGELALEDTREQLPVPESHAQTETDHQEALIGDGNSLKEIFEQNIENEDNPSVDTSSLPAAETTAHAQTLLTDNAGTVFHETQSPQKTASIDHEDIGAESEAYQPKFGDTGAQYTLRTRSMAEVLAEQDDPRGAMDIYRELLATADNPDEKSDLQSRIETLSQKLSQAEETPPSRDYETANPAPKSKAKLISMLEALAQRVEARMQG